MTKRDAVRNNGLMGLLGSEQKSRLVQAQPFRSRTRTAWAFYCVWHKTNLNDFDITNVGVFMELLRAARRFECLIVTKVTIWCDRWRELLSSHPQLCLHGARAELCCATFWTLYSVKSSRLLTLQRFYFINMNEVLNEQFPRGLIHPKNMWLSVTF